MLKYSSINYTADRQLMMKNQNVNFWTQIQREDLMRNEYWIKNIVYYPFCFFFNEQNIKYCNSGTGCLERLCLQVFSGHKNKTSINLLNAVIHTYSY